MALSDLDGASLESNESQNRPLIALTVCRASTEPEKDKLPDYLAGTFAYDVLLRLRIYPKLSSPFRVWNTAASTGRSP